MIYFIEDTGNGLIKIGTSGNPRRRSYTLRTEAQGALRFLLVMDGGKDQEEEVHKKFNEHRSHGEWFRPGPSLLVYIEEFKASNPDWLERIEAMTSESMSIRLTPHIQEVFESLRRKRATRMCVPISQSHLVSLFVQEEQKREDEAEISRETLGK